MSQKLERADVQRLLLDAFPKLDAALFLCFGASNGASRDRGRARKWLAELVSEVATDLPADRQEPAVQVAFTAPGLESFGLDGEALAGFSRPFREGMVTPHRNRALGDVGENDPGHWNWGADRAALDGVLLLYARDPEAAESLARRHEARLVEAGFAVTCLPACRSLRGPDGCFKEHFGFDDGMGNPRLRGLDVRDPEDDGREENRIASGEFVLGYANESQRFPPSPRISPGSAARSALPDGDFGRNGSYLVLRQLEQRVGVFWSYMLQGGDPKEAVRLAAKMVGRWPNGAPLARFAEEPPNLDFPDDFGYGADREGHGCPFGAHVRRVNPRDAAPMMNAQQSLAASRRRRLLRRGRSYGPPADGFADLDVVKMASAGDDDERGLFFLCFNADLETQFEFIQQTWVGSRKLGDLTNDADPLLSNPDWPPHQGPSQFTVQAENGSRRFTRLPAFVRVRGGAYLFLPGRRALEYLAGLSG